MRWHSISGLERRDWDGEAVVYDDASGDTHKLAPLPAAVLSILQAHPATVHELCDELAPYVEGEAAAAGSLLGHVSGALTELERQGLIDRVWP